MMNCLATRRRLAFALLAAAGLLTACGPSALDARKAATQKALSSLRKLQAAAQVGTTLAAYRVLLVDAQADVNEADQLVATSSIAWHLDGAMQEYKDAATIWNAKLAGKRIYDDERESHRLIWDNVAMYSGTHAYEEIEPEASRYGRVRNRLDPDAGMRNAWQYAGMHLTKAASMQAAGDPQDFSAAAPSASASSPSTTDAASYECVKIDSKPGGEVGRCAYVPDGTGHYFD